uniref:Sensory/regulatory protein RpfC n=1 Tax=Magnetococcus massalia (strain MO-1) TaxID=451514 RepID=A0A1S7LHY3_MAGMO|nr:putative Histidine kinase with PAS domain, HisKA domain, HATPase c domain and Response regulator receiver domain [Candidatus Magnetococcus massalia]
MAFLHFSFFRNIFLAAILVVLAFPAYLFWVVLPSFDRELVRITQEEATRVASHLGYELIREVGVLNRQSVVDVELARNVGQFLNELELYKLRIFSASGEILFSSDSKEIGEINKKPYFTQKVARGEVFAKQVKKGGQAAEGHSIELDVVEVYVPIMVLNQFHGALELYYDITNRKAKQIQQIQLASLVLVMLGVGLLGVMLMVLKRASHSYREKEQALTTITELGRQREELLNALGEGVYGIDAQGKTTFINPAGCRMLGWQAEEVLGKNQHTLFHHTQADGRRYPAEACPILQTLHSGEYKSVTNELFWRKDGSSFPVEYVCTPVGSRHGKAEGAVVVFHDISVKMESEEALRRAKEHAEQASRSKSEFLANVSHEIRTPMNAILGMTDLLGESRLDSEQQNFVRIVQSAGDALLQLINDILDISKIESGQLELEPVPFDLQDLTHDVMSIFKLRAGEKQLQLKVEVEPNVPEAVIGDVSRLRQVLINLVGNAIKFTETGGVVLQISLMHAEQEQCELRFIVTDTGIGIPKHRQQAIFLAFTQADASVTRQYGGTGLGLAICKRLVSWMGGDIDVTSEEGLGSSFHFNVPLSLASYCQLPLKRSLAELANQQVLMIGGHEPSHLIVQRILREQGCKLVIMGHPDELTEEQFQQLSWPLILLDVSTLGEFAFDFLAKLRALSSTAQIPVVLLGVDDSGKESRRAQQLGACYLLKPLRRSLMASTIGFALEMQCQVTPLTIPHEQEPLQILLVEDSADNALLVRTYLRQTPYHVEWVEDGEQSITQFKQKPYDLVLMDVQMPVMDGYSATRLIRAWERQMGRTQTPIIALTAHALKGDDEKSLAAGCDLHLTKPIKKLVLLDAIEKVMQAGGQGGARAASSVTVNQDL